MKKFLGIFLLTSIFVGTVFTGNVFAQIADKVAGTETIEFGNPLSEDTVEGLLVKAMKVIQGVVAVLAVLMIVVGGVMYITSAGSNQTETAKTVVKSAVIGLAIAFAAPSFIKETYEILGKGTPEVEGVDFKLSLYDIIINTTKTILNFIGALSVLMIIVGGVMYITNQSDEAKKIIKASVIGLVIALTSLVVVNGITLIFQ